jgi:hypothetical protein
MPSSAEMFGTEGPEGVLPKGMFDGITSRNYGFEPTAEEMEKQMEAVRYNKIVKMIKYGVKTFDLSCSEQVEEFRELYMNLYNKAAGGAVVIHILERQFVAELRGWLVHVEWSEYEFKKEDLLKDKEESK